MHTNGFEKLTQLLWVLGTGLLVGVACRYSHPLDPRDVLAQYPAVTLAMMGLLVPAILTLFTSRRSTLTFFPDEALLFALLVGLVLHSFLQGEIVWYTSRPGFLFQCGMSILILQIGTKAFPELGRYFIPWLIVLTGVFEALVGYSQLCGWSHSNHTYFALTGTFLNPGPFSGCLAVSFTVGLGLYRNLNTRWIRYMLLVFLVMMVGLLPAGMSRSAWVATAVGCVSIGCLQPPDFLTRWILLHTSSLRKRLGWGIAGTGIVILLGIGLYNLKKDSASGRLFMWKITTQMIAESPWTGCGLNRFPAVYGEAQEAYFATHPPKDWQEKVAGNPEYAFNEYLQIAAGLGIPFLIGILLYVSSILIRGVRQANVASVAGILAFGVFAFSSYPLHVPSLMLLLVVLLASAGSGSSGTRSCAIASCGFGWGSSVLWIVAGLAVGIYLYPRYIRKKEALRQWEQVRSFYDLKAYTLALTYYSPLYDQLRDQPDYLFEYAMCARQTENYEQSVSLLQQALLYSGDPMILNILGRNYENMAHSDPSQANLYYQTSEYYLLKSVHRVPGRLYPYYLLALLYSNPAWYHPEKAVEMAQYVLHTAGKIPSPAIEEMRLEMKDLLLRLHFYDATEGSSSKRVY